MACRDNSCTTSDRFVRILDFKHFERFFRFDQSDRKTYKKAISAGVSVSVVLDCGVGELIINGYTLELVIDDEAFQSCSVQNVVIGCGKVEIGDNAFSYCEDLVSVEIKGALSDIGDYAFYDCPAELVISYNGGSYNKESIEDAK